MSVLPCFLSLLQKKLPIKLRQNDVKYSYNVCNVLKMLKHNVGRAVRVIPLCFNMWHVELSFLTQSLFSCLTILCSWPSHFLNLHFGFHPHMSSFVLAPGLEEAPSGPQFFLSTSVSACLVPYYLFTCQSPLFNNESLGGRDLSLFTAVSPATQHCPVRRGWSIVDKGIKVLHEVNFHASTGKHTLKQTFFWAETTAQISMFHGTQPWDRSSLGEPNWAAGSFTGPTDMICTQTPVLLSSLSLPQPRPVFWPKPRALGPPVPSLASSSPWAGAEWQRELFQDPQPRWKQSASSCPWWEEAGPSRCGREEPHECGAMQERVRPMSPLLTPCTAGLKQHGW